MDNAGDAWVKFSGEGVSEVYSGKLVRVCLGVAGDGESTLVYGGKVD